MLRGAMTMLFEIPLLESEKIGREGYLLSFAKTGEFKAGQTVGVTLDPSVVPRLYSIASGETDPLMRILFNVQSAGELTPKLAQTKPGERLYVTAPQGTFVHDANDSWFIAAGTGIAPFLSMVRSGIRPLRLLHGARTTRDLYFYDELRFLEGYVCCVTRDSTSGPPMRLTRYLAEQPFLPPNVKYYLCGHPEMVVDVRALLLQKGVLFENIAAEIYF